MIVKRISGTGWVLDISDDEYALIGAALGVVTRSFDRSLEMQHRKACAALREKLLEGPWVMIARPTAEGGE